VTGVGTVRSTVLLLAALGVFWGSLANQFAFDDQFHVVENERIRSLGLDDLRALLVEPVYPGDLYRPLVTLSHALTYRVAGDRPFAHHLVNVALHGIATVLVTALLSPLLGAGPAFVAGLLFAVHPIHAEAVANVSGRSELLAAVFGLLMVRLAVAGSSTPRRAALRAVGVFACCLLALLSKESAVTFLLLAPLVLVARLGMRPGLLASRRPLAAAALAFLVYLALRIHALHGIVSPAYRPHFLDNPLVELPAPARIANATVLLGQYVRLILCPATLSADYSYAVTQPVADWLAPRVVVDLALVAGLGLLALADLRRGRGIGFCALWFLAAFAVTANVAFPLGTVFAERLAYVPSAGILGIVAIVVAGLRPRVAAWAAVGLAAVLLARTTVAESARWRDNATLHASQLERSGASAKTHLNLGMVLVEQRHFAEAAVRLTRALEIYPKLAQAAYGLAIVAAEQGDPDGAVARLEEALAIDPAHAPSLNMLGRHHLNRGEFASAVEYFGRTLAVDRGNFDARLGLLAVALNEKRWQDAAALRDHLRARQPGNAELATMSAYLDRALGGGSASSP
jgi:Tfp pilus assembly protein PilF